MAAIHDIPAQLACNLTECDALLTVGTPMQAHHPQGTVSLHPVVGCTGPGDGSLYHLHSRVVQAAQGRQAVISGPHGLLAVDMRGLQCLVPELVPGQGTNVIVGNSEILRLPPPKQKFIRVISGCPVEDMAYNMAALPVSFPRLVLP